MPAKKTTTPKKKKATPEQGVIYISSTGSYYEAPDITAERLKDFQDNVYGRGLALKQKHLIFSSKYELSVLDENEEQDEELENEMLSMLNLKEVDLWSKIQMAWWDVFWFGCGLFNPVWDYEGNVYSLKKLRYLPAHSFATAPVISSYENEIYSQILQGIILNDSGDIKFYQVQEEDGTPENVDNVWMIKEPTSTELAGSPTILPLVPIISMLKFAWDTQMQQVNRTGAKILFIKVTDPKPASTLNGNVSDVEHAQNILEAWGKNSAFVLRENMEIIDPQIKDDSNNLEIIDALNQMLIDYVSPISFITAKNDSARLGGSDTQRMEMILRYIGSIHEWLENAFEQLLQEYLDVNGYEGYHVKVVIPKPEVDTSELDLKRAEVGLKAKALTLNEIRVLLGEEELTDEDIVLLEEYWKRNQPEIPQFNFAAVSAKPDVEYRSESSLINESIDDLRQIGKRLSDGLMDAIEKES